MNTTWFHASYCAQDNNLSEESTNQAETDVAGDEPNMTRTEKQ